MGVSPHRRARSAGSRLIGAGFRKPVPTLLLEHRGRKSGKVFVTTLLYMFDGADVVIVASQGSAVVWTDREIPVVVLQPR